MRILSMTATFGKLEHETLVLKPDLNIIEAPNEWGKSTWCAFLVAMLYGIDTREKTTKTALAVKERFLPWSGSPMAGRMDIEWNGRNITIERKTKGRVPLGDFQAYETESGLPVPELTAANCGLTLLGVERNVFLRCAFIRHSDMPVTQDDALRRRLNALVTTGDESGDGDKLAKALKELKNKIRYNRTGLLPQAESQKLQLENTLRELENLESQSEHNARRLEQVQQQITHLENHQAALRYAAAEADARRVAAAQAAWEIAQQQLTDAQTNCQDIPTREQAAQVLSQVKELDAAQAELHKQAQLLPQPPVLPQCPPAFRGMTASEATAQAGRDHALYQNLSAGRPTLLVLGTLLALFGVILLFWQPIPGGILAVVGLALVIYGLVQHNQRKQKLHDLLSRYETADPANWLAQARAYMAAEQTYAAAQKHYLESHAVHSQRQKELEDRIHNTTQGWGLENAREYHQQVLDVWARYDAAIQEVQRAEHYRDTLVSMAKTAEPPTQPDTLTYSESETARLLADSNAELLHLQRLVSQNQGRMDTIGQKNGIESQLQVINRKIKRLENTYAAVTIAQETLAEATAELQRRFAPRISARAKELLSALTGGRYDRLTLGEDLTLRAGAQQEDTLHEALWRSDGTVDQLYFALRLAVAEALAENAPLVLDDAFIRFDDVRLKVAMDILREEAQNKQVILFTCQSRENNA